MLKAEQSTAPSVYFDIEIISKKSLQKKETNTQNSLKTSENILKSKTDKLCFLFNSYLNNESPV